MASPERHGHSLSGQVDVSSAISRLNPQCASSVPGKSAFRAVPSLTDQGPFVLLFYSNLLPPFEALKSRIRGGCLDFATHLSSIHDQLCRSMLSFSPERLAPTAARDETKPYPCFRYAEAQLPAVGFFPCIRRVNPWLFQRQPSFLGKADENSPHSLGSIGERESKKNRLRAGSQSFSDGSLVQRSASVVSAVTVLKKMQNAKGSNLSSRHFKARSTSRKELPESATPGDDRGAPDRPRNSRGP